MDIRSDASSLTPDARIELIELDLSPLGGDVLRLHAGTNGFHQPIKWQGNDYMPAAIEATGFEVSGEGQVPRPKLTIGNVSGVITGFLFDYDELRGATFTRIRTLGKYLDAANFPNGNPGADPTQEFPREVYTLDRVSRDNGAVVEWEMGAPYDVLNTQLPARVVIDNLCDAEYASGLICDWVPGTGGRYFDADDQPTTAENDRCSHCLSGCKARFGAIAPLPFGGFPAAGLVK